jgi:glycosyltransferase involved in cell wall biosynthesis
MKVLLAHNFYRSSAPSGEDSVYQNEKAMLQKRFDVITFERYNDDIDDSSIAKKIKLALNGAWSNATYNQLTALIRSTQPDIAHFHNTFPQISPSAFAACQDNHIPVVQTLHNYRFICPNALLLRNDKPCEKCIHGSLLWSLKYRCYRDSLLATGAQAWTIASNRWRGTYVNNVNRYIALTSFAADKLMLGGLPENRIEVKPNFLPFVPAMGKGEGNYAVYVGRLSEEKGVKTLIHTWKNFSDLPLKILGDGPLRPYLEQFVHQNQLSVEFLGYCSKDKIIECVGNAIFQIIPSNWYEGFPMVALEAYACGTPLIVSRIGSLDEIVKDDVTGVKFEPGNVTDLTHCIHKLLSNNKLIADMRVQARKLFLNHFTEEKNLEIIEKIYKNALADYKVQSS